MYLVSFIKLGKKLTSKSKRFLREVNSTFVPGSFYFYTGTLYHDISYFKLFVNSTTKKCVFQVLC